MLGNLYVVSVAANVIDAPTFKVGLSAKSSTSLHVSGSIVYLAHAVSPQCCAAMPGGTLQLGV
jgi:hypothetical protein